MKQKKVPIRKCIVCHESGEKKNLIRIVKNKDGEIFLDPTYKANGRGAYVHEDKECIDKLIKTKGLDRAFKTKVDQEVYEKIKSECTANE
ncbi:YlxR family protein [Criibacterium bergeronii]|uniref:YlxR family protein n=1 Tax=Criibacterium bergeronii TaxID=1871336 RepID=A0A552VD24_9FIRM|nr:YlxR family protein [Criibacterium bergeronii]TRW28373.1 YlxR family protein [Criibacterium bergeronii]